MGFASIYFLVGLTIGAEAAFKNLDKPEGYALLFFRARLHTGHSKQPFAFARTFSVIVELVMPDPSHQFWK